MFDISIFNNKIIKTLIIFFIVYYSTISLKMGIILSVIYIYIINEINNREIEKIFETTKKIKEIEHFSSSISRSQYQ